MAAGGGCEMAPSRGEPIPSWSRPRGTASSAVLAVGRPRTGAGYGRDPATIARRAGSIGRGAGRGPSVAGPALSARCPLGRQRHQLRALQRQRREGGAGAGQPGREHTGDLRALGSDRPDLARLPARGRPGNPLRLPGPRPLRAGRRPPLQPPEAAPRSVRAGPDRGDRVDARGLRLRLGPADDRRRPERTRLRRPRPALGGGRQPLRLGGDAASPHLLGRHRRLRDPRPRLHDAPSQRARAPARNVRRARPPRRHRAPQGARRHGRRADAGARVHRLGPSAPARPAQLLGLRHHRLLRPRGPLRGGGRPGRPGRRVQADGAFPPRLRARGLPRRRLQPHRRGQPPRSDALLPGHRQSGVLLSRPPRSSPLLGRDRDG